VCTRAWLHDLCARVLNCVIRVRVPDCVIRAQILLSGRRVPPGDDDVADDLHCGNVSSHTRMWCLIIIWHASNESRGIVMKNQ
jgi:hypothetical protein